MTWLTPQMAPALLLLPLLLALYLFRPRPQRTIVPSLRLWEGLAVGATPRTRPRRPPASALLLLQALVLLAGAVALLRPAFTAPAPRHLVILLDASGSMQQVTGGQSRWDAARAAAHTALATLGPGERATLLRVGAGVTTACAACLPAEAGAALDALRPGVGAARWDAALALVTGLAGRAGAGQVDPLLLSDGAWSSLDGADLPPHLRYELVGTAGDNRAITALNVRGPPDGSASAIAYARVENAGRTAATLTIQALADTVPLPVRSLVVPAGGHADLTWQVPAGTGRFTVRLDPPDALVADDAATVALPIAGQYKARIVAAQPDLYVRALAGIPQITAVLGGLETNAAFTILILEGVLPNPLPSGPLLLVNPQGAAFAGRVVKDVRPLPASNDHPLLSGLDLQALLVREAHPLAALPGLEPLVQTTDGALLLAGERDGRRIVVLAFDPRSSNLPKLAAFPVLLANVVQWLYPLAGLQALAPGEALRLPPGASVQPPDGAAQPVPAGGVFAATDGAGLYTVRAAGSTATFSVNMTNAAESGTPPQAHPELAAPPAPPAPAVARQEVWGLLAALALALLGGEWLLYCWKRGRA